MMTRAEPMTNLLRTTVAAFAAAVGGADSIAVLPHDIALGAASPGARALARSMQHLLMEESHLHVVGDPAAGSGAVEALTEGLAERGWEEFRAIEREGGIVESLRTGAFQQRIRQARAALAANLAKGVTALVGVTMHRHADEEPASPTTTSAATTGLRPITLEELARAAA
jgi:methylmalonyl-CoA mutase